MGLGGCIDVLAQNPNISGKLVEFVNKISRRWDSGPRSELVRRSRRQPALRVVVPKRSEVFRLGYVSSAEHYLLVGEGAVCVDKTEAVDISVLSKEASYGSEDFFTANEAFFRVFESRKVVV
ncbi:uncharacterized protein N7459_002662 [Penicillium hispanicum]|uniref:uncharacterized protein n=1 Tax=Penicillium hispanicum TaxID=1080232 RepID=UPI0025419534|nr:uncharacterized protein N7459_002662 [Penicillium hispanicum]KAJ5586897.1 hypothetical protein N7459_002662 [Penicillium hispanicum]